MINDLNAVIKEEAGRILKRYLIITPLALVGFSLFIYQFYLDTGVIVVSGAVMIFPFAPLILVYITINHFRRTKNPNAKKCIERFCNKTADPNATFRLLEQTWKHGLVLEEIEHIVKFMKPVKLPTIHISKEYAIGATSTGVKIIPLKNAVWAYSDNAHKLHVFYMPTEMDTRTRRITQPKAMT